jgi:hypothetical protein
MKSLKYRGIAQELSLGILYVELKIADFNPPLFLEMFFNSMAVVQAEGKF